MHTTEGRWIQINATREATEIVSSEEAEDVLIVIGENPDKTAIEKYLPVR